MDEDNIAQNGINILIGGNFKQAVDYFSANYEHYKTDKLLHLTIIAVLLNCGIEDYCQILRKYISEGQSVPAAALILQFINKNQSAFFKISRLQQLFNLGIFLKKLGFLQLSREYINICNLLAPADPVVKALLAEYYFYEKDFKTGLDYLMKAALI